MEKSLPDRTIYFDYLRVFATLAVMVLHVSSQNWHGADVNGNEWHTFIFFDSIVRWGVPVFIMISGALFLERNIPLKKVYSKYIFRLLASFVTWSFLYALFEGENVRDIIKKTALGHYHMWFILMIVGLYICVPIIKMISKDRNISRYYLFLALIFAFIIPEAITLINDFGNETLINGGYLLSKDVDAMRMSMVLGYGGYFVLGYYINKTAFSKKTRKIIYALGALGFMSTILLSAFVSVKTQEGCGRYYNEMTVNVLLESLAVFIWFKNRKYNSARLNTLVRKLSKYCFGAYLVHALVIEQLQKQFGLDSLSFDTLKPVSGVMCISIIVIFVSFGASAVLNHIPIVKRYMV